MAAAVVEMATSTIQCAAPSADTRGLKIVCVSDTHDFQKAMSHVIPPADILVHAGALMFCLFILSLIMIA
jgi:hypothetical protein